MHVRVRDGRRYVLLLPMLLLDLRKSCRHRVRKKKGMQCNKTHASSLGGLMLLHHLALLAFGRVERDVPALLRRRRPFARAHLPSLLTRPRDSAQATD
jgi:hypothetical protein